MSRDALCRYTLAPLVLRLTLASIFIYHGVVKVASPENEAGAAWADNHWQRRARPTPDILERVRAGTAADKRAALEEQLHLAYAQSATPIPKTLENRVAQMAVAWGELIGGALLLFGFLTRLAALAEIIIQIGAVYWVTWAHGFSFARSGGYEYNLVLLGTCLTLMLVGGGRLAVDALLFRSRSVGEVSGSSQQPALA